LKLIIHLHVDLGFITNNLIRVFFYNEYNFVKAIVTYLKVMVGRLDEPHEGLMESRSVIKEVYAVQAITELFQTFLQGYFYMCQKKE